MKMFGACTDKMDPVTSYIEPANLSGIELSHGSNGGKNGSTVGGSYNMVLEKPDLNRFKAESSVFYETVSKGKTGTVSLNYGKEKWAYRVNGALKDYLSYTDGNKTFVPFTQYRKLNLLQSLLLAPSDGYNFTFDYLIDDAFDVGYPALPMDVSHAKGRIYSVSYSSNKPVLNISSLKTKIYANTVYHVMDDSQRDSLYFVENHRTGSADSVYMKMDMPGWSNTYGAFVEGYSWLNEKNKLFFKLENYYNWSKAEMTMYMNNLSNPGEPPMFAETWPEHERNVTGLFLKNTTRLMSNLAICFDVRADFAYSRLLSEQGKNQFLIFEANPGKSYNKFVKTVNLNLSYQPFTEVNTQSGIGYGERLPTLSEQFGFYLFNALDGYDYIGNPGVHNEKTVNFWTNINYAKPKLKLTFEAYTNLMRDYILGVAAPEYEALNLYASGVKKYTNIGGAFLFSTNFQMLWNPVAPIEIFSVSKYNYGQISGDEPLPLIAPFKTISNITYKKPKYYIQAEAEYAASQNRINHNFGETPTSSYLLFHLRSAYNLKIEKAALKFSLGIENIFNTVYSEHLDWGDFKRPGRNFYLELEYSL